ncbi:MAG: hypothetical protein FWC47_06930 [Oscillospiraceae bacterium]|nr:hypothetical protein [Oscillospiraceae bacterium]
MLLTETEILLRLNKTAKEKNINLTYSQKLFFLRLLNYMVSNKLEDYTITMAIENMAKTLNFSKSTVAVGLIRLEACGAIMRMVGASQFQRKPYTIILNNKIIEQE